jgi:hypothetical protein
MVVAFKIKWPKRQEVEVVSFLRLEFGKCTASVLPYSISQSPRPGSRAGDTDFFDGRSVKEFRGHVYKVSQYSICQKYFNFVGRVSSREKVGLT